MASHLLDLAGVLEEAGGVQDAMPVHDHEQKAREADCEAERQEIADAGCGNCAEALLLVIPGAPLLQCLCNSRDRSDCER